MIEHNKLSGEVSVIHYIVDPPQISLGEKLINQLTKLSLSPHTGRMNQENTNSKNEKDPVRQHWAFSMIGADNLKPVRLGSSFLTSIYALLMPLWIKGQPSPWQEENSYWGIFHPRRCTENPKGFCIMSDRLPLTDLPRALIEAGYEAPTYRTCYNATVDGRIPTKKTKNGRWVFSPEDLPAIADAMRLSDAHAA
jgi:hypothetical protein